MFSFTCAFFFKGNPLKIKGEGGESEKLGQWCVVCYCDEWVMPVRRVRSPADFTLFARIWTSVFSRCRGTLLYMAVTLKTANGIKYYYKLTYKNDFYIRTIHRHERYYRQNSSCADGAGRNGKIRLHVVVGWFVGATRHVKRITIIEKDNARGWEVGKLGEDTERNSIRIRTVNNYQPKTILSKYNSRFGSPWFFTIFTVNDLTL